MPPFFLLTVFFVRVIAFGFAAGFLTGAFTVFAVFAVAVLLFRAGVFDLTETDLLCFTGGFTGSFFVCGRVLAIGFLTSVFTAAVFAEVEVFDFGCAVLDFAIAFVDGFFAAVRVFVTGVFGFDTAFLTVGFADFDLTTILETFRVFGETVLAFNVFDFAVLVALSLNFEVLEVREELTADLLFCVLPPEACTRFLTAFFIWIIVL
ncbi:MAG: hypothetical protein ACR2F2_10375 [Pyrinomonadaceae bacterium]